MDFDESKSYGIVILSKFSSLKPENLPKITKKRNIITDILEAGGTRIIMFLPFKNSVLER